MTMPPAMTMMAVMNVPVIKVSLAMDSTALVHIDTLLSHYTCTARGYVIVQNIQSAELCIP